MARGFNSKTISLEDGLLTFEQPGDYSITLMGNGKYKVSLEGGQTTILSKAEFESVEQLDLKQGVQLTLDAEHLTGIEVANLEGSLNVTGVGFTEPGSAGSFETSVDLDTLLGSALDAHGAGHVVDHLAVDGSEAEAFMLLWDYLDDAYVAGNNYYNLDVNENFVRLGLEYIEYLENGGEPLTFVTAKYAVDSDGDGIPQRAQSMHDNLLGNLWGPAIEDRFDGALEAELLALIPDDYETRPTFDGNEQSLGNVKHDAVRAFDYEHGWDRPDYIETTSSGEVDLRAQDTADGDMLYGDGNSTTGWNIVRHEGAGIELALKAKERGGADYVATEIDGVAHYHVDGGLDQGSTNRAAWNFDFAMTSGISGQDETIDQFDFKLLIDVDATEGTHFLEIDPASIPDNPASDYSEQNSWNYGFSFINGEIDGDPSTEGVQPYDFDGGQFDIVLEAYDQGVLIASNHIVVHGPADGLGYRRAIVCPGSY